MVLLLALLVLLVSSAVAALLTWWATRAALPLLALVGLVVAAGIVLAFAVSRDDDDLSLEPSDALAAESESTADPETTAATSGTASLTPEATPSPTVNPTAAPEGPRFVAEPVLDEGAFSSPTSFAMGDDGELYVGHDFGIEVVRDTTGDGYYDYQQHFGLEGGWVFGLDYYEGSVYAAVAGSVVRLQDLDGDDVADEVVTLTEGLPHNQYGGHSNSGLTVGPDGLLYMAIGGTSDHGPELEPFGGTILTMPLQGGAPALYASGFRNPYDLTFCPDGRLFAVDNGPDQLDEVLTFRPWDEVNLVEFGGNYGYPNFFGIVPAETGTISPIARVAPSAGITGITCYTGDAYPAEYAGDLFVTLWGTFTFPVETGRSVMWVDVVETPDGPRGTAAQLVDGFGHPIDIINAPDGNLLVLDYQFGQVLRIRYTGA